MATCNKLLLAPVGMAIAGIALGGLSASPNQQPEFEVASVKPVSRPTMAQMAAGHYRLDDAAFEEAYASLSELITMAYRMNWNRLSGPNWLNEQFFSIAAKLPAGASKDQVPAMLQKLLADRFQLSVHREQKVEPAYLLLLDPKGPQLKPAKDDEQSALQGCSGRPGQYSCRHVTLAELAEQLSARATIAANMPSLEATAEVSARTIDHPVIDQTGLSGVYDIDLQWVPPEGLGPGRNGGRGSANFPARDPTVKATSIFAALEAAGFKLQPGKHAFDYLVVDHVERVPSEN